MSDVHPTNEGFEMRDLSNMIDKLKENPEIVASLASTLGFPLPDAAQSGSTASPSPALPDMLSSIAPLISSGLDKGNEKKPDDPRTNLLFALRPYLSPQRQEIVDYILKLSRMGELLKKLK